MVEELGGLDNVVVVPPKNSIRGDILETTSMQFDAVCFFNYIFCFHVTQFRRLKIF